MEAPNGTSDDGLNLTAAPFKVYGIDKISQVQR